MHPSLKIFFMCLLILCLFRPAGADEVSINYYDIGVFAYEEGDFAGAEKFLKQAVILNPDNGRACFYLGQTYTKLEQTAKAEEYLTTAFEIDPSISGLKYALGLLCFEKNDFGNALAKFDDVITENPADVLAVYYAGICRYKFGQYEHAENLLVKAAQMSPTIEGNGYYYAGICNYYMERLDRASDQFEQVAETARTDDMKESARLWLQAVGQKKETQKPYAIFLKTGFIYDDNVMLAPADQDVISDESDTGMMAYFNGKYDLVKWQKFVAGVGYNHYMTRYRDLDAYDLTGSIGNLYLDWRLNDLISFGGSYQPTYYWVDAESYLMQHQASASMTGRMDKLNILDFSYRYSRNNYFTDSFRDGHSNTVRIDFSHGFNQLNGYLFCGIGSEFCSASAKDQDFTEIETLLGFSYDFFSKTNITIFGNYFDKSYDEEDTVYQEKRDDSRYFVSASVNQTLWQPWLQMSAEYSFTKNNSSISEFDYERNAVLLSVSIKL